MTLELDHRKINDARRQLVDLHELKQRRTWEVLALNPECQPWMELLEIEGGTIITQPDTQQYISYHIGSPDDPINVGMGLTETPHSTQLMGKAGYNITLLPENWIIQAQVERATYLSQINSPAVIERIQQHQIIDHPKRKPLFLPAIQRIQLKDTPTIDPAQIIELMDENHIPSMGSFGYQTYFSHEPASRRELVTKGIFTKLGKYIRSPFCMAPMPHSAGSINSIATAAQSHMLAVIPRNYQFADIQFQVDFARDLIYHLESFHLAPLDNERTDEHQNRNQVTKSLWKRNICAAIGVGKSDLQRVKELYGVGIRSFRIYTVATDPHLSHQLGKLIQEIKTFEDQDIEIFIGQMTSIEQLNHIINYIGVDDWNKYVNGIYIGNGGGSVCSTATTGMIVNTPDLINSFRNHPHMSNVSIIIEGGMNTEPLPPLFGADGMSYASELIGVESPGGRICYEKDGKYYKVYAGEASIMAKEAEGLIDQAGNPIQIEGQIGVRKIQIDTNASITHVIHRLNELLAQVMVKIGCTTFEQIHSLGTFMTEAEMHDIWGENWSKHPYMKVIPDVNKLIEYIRTHTNQYNMTDEQIAQMYGISSLQEQLYIVPNPLRYRSPQVKHEGSPHGSGL